VDDSSASAEAAAAGGPLADGRSASAPETVLQIVRGHRLGMVIGERTGGTNGNVASFQVPGGYTVRFTGMRAVNHDGSLLHGKGIDPDVPVAVTVAGTIAGRDEVLDAAVEMLASEREP